jgi:broad specificity phosphatase PhoE
MAETLIYLMRHGETAENACRPFVLQGNGVNGPLNEIGLRQAQSLAATLAQTSFTAIYSSPMLRARQTAQFLADPRQISLEPSPALEEVNVGRWMKMSWAQIKDQYPAEAKTFLANPGAVPYLGGESYLDVQARALPALDAIARQHLGETIAIVAHNVVNKAILSHALKLPISQARSLHQTNCCINILRWTDGRLDVEVLNSDLHVRNLPGTEISA